MELYSEELKKLLEAPKDIVIVSHRNPDGDAIGSSLGLKLLLKRLGHFVQVIMPSEYPNLFHYLPTVDETIIWDLEHDRCRYLVSKADLIFCLDFNGLDRIDKLGIEVGNSQAYKVLIDHHLDPEPFVDFTFSDTEASSTSEMVYQFIQDMGYLKFFNKEMGACLLTGIITDTGSFKYGTRAYTYTVASKLKESGVDDYEIQNYIVNSLREKHLRILGHCLANRMEVIPEHRAALIHLTKQDYIDYDIQRGDTEGVVNHMLMMKDVDIAAFITEQPTIVKLSLRSKGDISVQEMATKYFNGGGHKNASGGGVYASLEDVIARYKKVLPEFNQI